MLNYTYYVILTLTKAGQYPTQTMYALYIHLAQVKKFTISNLLRSKFNII